MKIEMMKVPICELVAGYDEDGRTGRVVAWGGKLDVRPEYQREYVYGVGQRDAVVNTVLNGFPLNIMYFVDRKDGTYEVLDGQQRIISICRYATNNFSVIVPSAVGQNDAVNFPNLYEEQRKRFLDYELQVYLCEGTDKEKLDWFQVINIAGEELELQEIRNALYHGTWLTDAKSVFSRRNCAAYKYYGKYLKGDCIRQKYLETALAWAADAEGIRGRDAIVSFMQKHRDEDDADELWKYFERVFAWVEEVFGSYDRAMKGIKWGLLYNAHKHDNFDSGEIRERIAALMADKEVQRKSGIYEYLLTGDEKHLNLRQFDEDERRTMYARQNGRCNLCGEPFEFSEMHGDHIEAWSKGGKTTLDNGQMLCISCNLSKSDG